MEWESILLLDLELTALKQNPRLSPLTVRLFSCVIVGVMRTEKYTKLKKKFQAILAREKSSGLTSLILVALSFQSEKIMYLMFRFIKRNFDALIKKT